MRWYALPSFISLLFLTNADLDADECKHLNNCSSLAKCNNTIGSYECVCKEGYSGSGFECDGISCLFKHHIPLISLLYYFYFLFRLINLDIDECLATNQCNIKANCSNLVGSYNCSCLPGYSGNGYECSGKSISSFHSHHSILFLIHLINLFIHFYFYSIYPVYPIHPFYFNFTQMWTNVRVKRLYVTTSIAPTLLVHSSAVHAFLVIIC